MICDFCCLNSYGITKFLKMVIISIFDNFEQRFFSFPCHFDAVGDFGKLLQRKVVESYVQVVLAYMGYISFHSL